MNNIKSERIRKRILIPLGFVFLLSLGACVITLYHFQQRHIDDYAWLRLNHVRDMFQEELEEEAKLMNSQIHFLKQNKDLHNAWLAKDRDALLGHTVPIFNEIHTKYGVTHFYFHGLDRICFLRVHKPEKHGDYIERFTLNGAVREDKPVHGMEMGPYGTFTLRTVHPWRINGELAGYLELGIEIGHITLEMKEMLGVEIFFTIDKSYLNHSNWEQGLKILGRTGDWEMFDSFVLIKTSTSQVPQELKRHISSYAEDRHHTSIVRMSLGGRSYRGQFLPLIDAPGRDVGDIVVLGDVTAAEAAMRTSIAIVIVFGVILGIGVFGYFYVYLGSMEHKLVNAHNDLRDEIEERKRAESTLQKNEKRLKDEVHQRKHAEKRLKHAQAELQKQVTELVEARQATLNMMEDIEREITERKQAEKTLERAYIKLENTNRELKEVQSQMVQSEKLASIGQLAAGVAHEMNTPVGFVASNFQTLGSYVEKIKKLLGMYDELTTNIETLGKAELLNKAGIIGQSRGDMKIDFILEDIQELFDDSKEGMERITSIIQNLRDFSRIDQPDSLDEYDLNKGIETTLVVARNEIKYDADIETDFSEIPAVFCNSGQINQVFLNVLVNAIQAIKSLERDKKGIITIKTYSTDEHVVCEICDDGPGIPPDKLSKVFDPFFTTKPAGKGTGLGLSVSYDIIVHKHNGEIFADSTLGKGSKFTIKLPIKWKNQNGKKELETNEKENSVICG